MFFLELNYPNLSIYLLFFESLSVPTCFSSSVNYLSVWFSVVEITYELYFFPENIPSGTLCLLPSGLFTLSYSVIVFMELSFTIVLSMMCLIRFSRSCGFFLKIFWILKCLDYVLICVIGFLFTLLVGRIFFFGRLGYRKVFTILKLEVNKWFLFSELQQQ